MNEKVIFIINAEDAYIKDLPKNSLLLKKTKSPTIKLYQDIKNDKSLFCGCSPEVGKIYVKHPIFNVYFTYESPEDLSFQIAKFTAQKIKNYYRLLGARYCKFKCKLTYREHTNWFSKVSGKTTKVTIDAAAGNDKERNFDASISSSSKLSIPFSTRMDNYLKAKDALKELELHSDYWTFKSDYDTFDPSKGISGTEERSCKLTKSLSEELEIMAQVSLLEGVAKVDNSTKVKSKIYEEISSNIELEF